MDPITISGFLSLATGYILKGALESKALKDAKEDLLSGFWKWIRPLFIEDIPELETNPTDIDLEFKIQEKLIKLFESPDFFKTLAIKVEDLHKSGLKEKNIVQKDISRVKKIKIGDKVYLADDLYNRKNIVKGNINDADEFTLGDGH